MDDPLSGRYADLGVGLLLGLAAALACAAAWAWRRRHLPGAATPVAGLALAAAGAIGLAAIGGGPTTLALPWPAIAVAAGVAGVLLADFDRRWQRLGLALPLLAISAAGIYATVPDVEAAVVALGAALPMSLLGWPGPLARSRHGRARRQPAADAPAQPPPSLGRAGALATAGLLVWTVTTGSVGRSSSVVGGLGCLGLLAVEPIARLLDPRRRSPLASLAPRQVPWSALATHLLLVGVAARVVGRQTTVQGALLLGALALAAALAAALAVGRRWAVGDRTPS